MTNTQAKEEIRRRNIIEELCKLYQSFLEEMVTHDGGGSFWGNDRVKELEKTLLAQAVQEERERIIKMWNEHCKEYSPHNAGENGDWCDRFAIKLSTKLRKGNL